VDSDLRAVAAIRANLAAVGLVGTVVRSDAVAFLGRTSDRFDLVLADPPYAFTGWVELLDLVPEGLVVLESGRALDLPPGWNAVRSRRYGDSVVTLARRS
ncbi:MAG: RsmD family RNA methyltransferase, partial [Acidimicrobiales bacterium]